jgi:predicted MFS family arabinose efflux permease
MTTRLTSGLKQYLLITGNYWAFTLTDGALRMLVVLYFHQLGYSPLAIAMLFLFYEIFGVITNLVGGWLGAQIGLNRTMNLGLTLQVAALAMLLVPLGWLTVPWVMAAQALSGIAKDLNKMSAKSAIKGLVANGSQTTLFKWVAVLTGSKNALKGAGFFLGGFLLDIAGFQGAVLLMASALTVVLVTSLISLDHGLGKLKNKAKFSEVFSRNRTINVLAAARMFLFGARDVWFVVALPVYLSMALDWDHWQVGSFLALWIISYGAVQAFAPKLLAGNKDERPPGRNAAASWVALLAFIPLLIALGLAFEVPPLYSLVGGLLLFGAVFAVNSSLHSYLIVSYAREEGASMDVGFYYMANAMGRLIGTVLSGWVFQESGLIGCLSVSTLFLVIATLLTLGLPKRGQVPQKV